LHTTTEEFIPHDFPNPKDYWIYPQEGFALSVNQTPVFNQKRYLNDLRKFFQALDEKLKNKLQLATKYLGDGQVVNANYQKGYADALNHVLGDKY
jgi:hypothetical protein